MGCKISCLLLVLISVSFGAVGQQGPGTSGIKPDTALVNRLLGQSKEKFQSDPPGAIELANQAKTVAGQINYPVGIAYAFKNIGIVYYFQGKFLQSLENYEQALALFDSLGDKKGSGNILSNMGAIYFDKGDNTRSLEYHLRSLKLSEEIGDKLRIASSLNNIGAVYTNINDTSDKAMEYFRQSLIISRELRDNYLIGTASVNLGEVFMGKNLDDSALVYFNESLRAYEGTEDIAYTLTNIGKVYRKKKKFALALKFQRMAFDNASKLSNQLDMLKSLNSLAETYYQSGDNEKAIEHFRNAELLAVEIGSKTELKIAYEGLAKTYAFLGDFKNAFNYQGLFVNIKDTLFNIEANNKLSGLQFDFDIQKKENQINSLIQQKTLDDARLKKEKIFRYALFIGLALIFIIAFTQWQHSKHRQQANKLLQVQKKETEQQKEKAEKALDELKATQAQLIQSEKMASMGELTAGIAHEIQNPLNFVNNFSELNGELLGEMKDEINNGKIEAALILANDAIENQKKINLYGKRADAIVKGMLQHSRSSRGVKEPTDINALADEYFRLAYHGLKAKDTTFNATMKTQYDERMGRISVIPQDVGRVILNLISNAFYAVTEKKVQQGDRYEPVVSVSTKRNHSQVEIRVSDNGNGIRQEVRDKIFQPFFTTKPTGQGTGLGLSLSYDIVKAHGGELKVETREGDGSEFIILLPVTTA